MLTGSIGDGAQTVIGSNFADTFAAYDNDTLTGGLGNDTFNVNSGTVTITDFHKDIGNTDTLNVASGATAIASNVLDFTGYTVNNLGTVSITGTSGADTIVGTNGNDYITAGLGGDTITGGAGADTFNITAGTASITDLGNGADALVVSSNAVVNANVSNLTNDFTATAATSHTGTGTVNLTVGNSGTVDLHLATGSLATPSRLPGPRPSLVRPLTTPSMRVLAVVPSLAVQALTY